MRRRSFVLAALGAACAPQALLAQRTYTVGLMVYARADRNRRELERVLIERLAAAGFVEGRNLRVVREEMGFDEQAARQAARRLSSSRPDVVYAESESLVDALRGAAGTLPIVFVFVTEPVKRGYVRDLAHPAGMITGVTDRYVETGVKRLELLREVSPRARRVAFVAHYGDRLGLDAWRAAASRLGFEVIEVDLDGKRLTMQRALENAVAQGASCLMPIGRLQGVSGDDGALLAFLRFAGERRLPAVYSDMGVVTRLGGLMSLDVDRGEIALRGADMVVRVLQGQAPSTMAVQEPDRFTIVVNLKAARAQGIAIPESLLLRATEVVR